MGTVEEIIHNVRLKLPKVINARYGLRTWIQDYRRDSISLNVKQEIARASHLADVPQAVIYDKIFTYEQIVDNKYKLVDRDIEEL